MNQRVEEQSGKCIDADNQKHTATIRGAAF